MTMETPRLLFVHAHPDDETLTTGATIARYVALGAQVQVITCTLGEEGEVIGEQWAQLAVDHADQLGGYRIAELTAALGTLKAALSEGAGESALDEATHAQNALLPAMDAVRAGADKLETVVADDLWPLPTYQEMLYIL